MSVSYLSRRASGSALGHRPQEQDEDEQEEDEERDDEQEEEREEEWEDEVHGGAAAVSADARTTPSDPLKLPASAVLGPREGG